MSQRTISRIGASAQGDDVHARAIREARSTAKTLIDRSPATYAALRGLSLLMKLDLLLFGRGTRVTHIGIYVGEGKYVHAANRRKGVIESEISPPDSRWWKGARRVIPEGDLSALVRGT